MLSKPIFLANALGLQPLDRVQINNAKEIDEFMFFSRRGQNFDLPFFYFQRVLPDGMMEVRSPGGYATSIRPEDICDVIHAEPVVVRAMPRAALIEWQRLSVAEQQKTTVPAERYAEAYVMYARKDKWGGVEAMVWFKDLALNLEPRPVWATVLHEDRPHLNEKAKRTVMPVQNHRSSANYSSDAGVERSRDHARQIVARMFKAAAQGKTTTVELLASIGDKKISVAALNKLAA